MKGINRFIGKLNRFMMTALYIYICGRTVPSVQDAWLATWKVDTVGQR